MTFSIRSSLAFLGIVALFSAPIFSQNLPMDDLVPDDCLLQFDAALDCVLNNVIACIGIIDLADSLPTMATEVDSCEAVQDLTCSIYEACEPCAEEFSAFLDCTVGAVLTGSLELRQGDALMDMNMTDCMNMTDTDDMIIDECMNMTDAGGSVEGVLDPALLECDLGPEACV